MRYALHFYRGSRLRCIVDVPGEVLTGKAFFQWAKPHIELQAEIGRDDWMVVPEHGRTWHGFVNMVIKDAALARARGEGRE